MSDPIYWRTRRRNRFGDPRARTLTGKHWGTWATSFTLSEITDADGTRWIRAKRIDSTDARTFELMSPGMVHARVYRLRCVVRASVAMPATIISIRNTNATSSTGTNLRTLDLPAGESIIDVSGQLPTNYNPTSTCGFVIVTKGSTGVNATLDIREVLIDDTFTDQPYFDGNTPDVPDVSLYSWEGTADDSFSKEEEVDPEPHWRDGRRNVFFDPEAQNINPDVASVWSCGAAHNVAGLTDADGTKWIRSTRSTASSRDRAMEIKFDTKEGIPYRLRCRVRLSHPTTIEVQLQADYFYVGGEVIGMLDLPAGESIIDVRAVLTSLAGYGDNSGFSLITEGSDAVAGMTLDVREVLIDDTLPNGSWFDGNTPDETDKRYYWELGDENAHMSPSVEQNYVVIPNDGPIKYAPVIFVLNVPLPCEFEPDGQNAVVLDGFEISWGRDALYDETSPSEFRFDMIDPTGKFASDPALYGSAVTVETSLGVLFRGQIDGVSIEPIEINDPNTNVPNDVWLVHLSATDMLASIAKLSPAGQMSAWDALNLQYAYTLEYGPGYWGLGTPSVRMRHIEEVWRRYGITTEFQDSDWAGMAHGEPWDTYFKEPALRAGPSLYDLAQQVIKKGDRPLFANYLPGPDILYAEQWPAPAIVVDGVMKAGQGHIVDCSTVEVVEPGAVESTTTHNIGAIKVTELRWEDIDYDVGGTIHFIVRRYAAATVERRISNPSGGETAQYEVGTNHGTDSGQSAAEFMAQLDPYIVEMNGHMVPPDFVFDLQEHAYGATLETALMVTWAARVPWAFPGSKYDALTGFGPVFQHIGGSLAYSQGWRVTARYAPGRVKK